MAMPGDRKRFRILLRVPMPVSPDMPFAMREGGVTIGAGRIISVEAFTKEKKKDDKKKEEPKKK